MTIVFKDIMLTGGVTGTAHDTDSCSAAREPERPSLVGLGRAESFLPAPRTHIFNNGAHPVQAFSSRGRPTKFASVGW